VNTAPGRRFAASQQRKPQCLDLGHVGAREVTISDSQQHVRLVEQNRWSLRKLRQRHGRRKTRLANAKRWTCNARSKNLDPHKYWSVQTMFLHQLAYIHKPTLKPPTPPRTDPAPGSWVCCECRTTNNSALSPTRCPLDGHYKCTRCYVYPRPQPQPRPTQPRPKT
jgi:hypothetical protein